MMEVAGKLKMQQLQGILADKWRPYMENLDTMYTDATCYESEMRYPTDTKLLWEGIEKNYATMCELSGSLGIHRPRTKFLDVQKANLTYRKQRKHNRSQTRKITRRLLDLLSKILKEIREIERGKEVKSVEFGGCLTLKLAVNAELLWGELYPHHEKQTKKSGRNGRK